MIALQIQEIRSFMNKLLLDSTFDRFYLVEGSVSTYNTFHIDGHLHKDFFSREEIEEHHLESRTYSFWKEVKPFCLSLIKGKKTPLAFRFTFMLSKENTERLLVSSGIRGITPENVSALMLHIKYENSKLTCITGTSLNFFTMDKTLEHAWDAMIERFLKQQEISYL
ncbi:MAG: DUF5721 family protein [Lachnospiraceae bacterium]